MNLFRSRWIHRLAFGTIRGIAKVTSYIPFIDRAFGRLGYGLVILYRRFLSPWKGFRCAHAVVTSGPSCSDVGLGLFRSQSLSAAVSGMDSQFRQCRQSHALAMSEDFWGSDGGDEVPDLLLNDIVCCDLSK